MNRIALLLTGLLVFAAVACEPSPQQTPPPQEELSPMARTADTFVGRWQSVEGEVRPAQGGGKSYLKRDFTNTPDMASATLIFYADSTFTGKNITVLVEGPYDMKEPSGTVDGAFETDFTFSTMKMTPHNQYLVDFLTSAEAGTCGENEWAVDVEQDVSSTDGCSVFGIQLSTYTEYDLVKVDGDMLYYGARPDDGGGPDSPEKRPTALQVPLQRVQ